MYSGHGLPAVSSSPAAASTQPEALVGAPAEIGEQKILSDKVAEMSAAPPPPEPRVLSKEEKVEYRDQDGNLLNDEQVAELQGKVEFKTKYETRTRVVDEGGNEVPEPNGGWEGQFDAPVAPPHPDVEGVDQETVKGQQQAQQVREAAQPQDAAASKDGEKEAERAKAKPASEGQEATVREEL